jgi:flagellar hook-associated protein 2
MTNRITGLATGLDIDALVKTTMTAYRTKVDATIQKKDVYEIKQKLYRDVISEGKKLFNNYFDLAKSDSLLSSKSYITTKFDSGDKNVATATALAGAIKDTYTVSVDEVATCASSTIKLADLATGFGNQAVEFDYNGKKVSFDISGIMNDAILTNTDKANALATTMNTKLSSLGISATYSDIAGGLVLKSRETGETIGAYNNSFTISKGSIATDIFTADASTPLSSTAGTNLKAKITSSNGEKIIDSISNKVTLEGVQFNFTSSTIIGAVDTPVKLVGTTDVTAAKDKIVKFIDEYNTYIEKLNKLTTETHDRSYNPLTKDQKAEMSETEITLWNTKVEKGQLSRDSDLSRIVNNLKNAFSSSVTGAGINLEKIGITPIQDYSSKNGMFKVDEEKLTAALESNPNEIISLFTKAKPTDETLSATQKESMTGIAYRMKAILDNEFMSSTKSSLIQKAGYEGTTYFSQSTLSKSIASYELKISDMEDDLTDKEQALYSKYSKLETVMNNYNTQLSYLNTQMGTSSS